MRTRRHFLIVKMTYLVIDVCVLLIALYCAFLWRQGTLPAPLNTHPLVFDASNPFRLTIIIWLSTILFMNQTFGLYQTKREMLESLEITAVLKAILISTFVMIVFVYILKLDGLPRGVTVVSVVLMFMGLSLWRILKKCFVDYLVRTGYNNFNVLIIGAGRVGQSLFNEIKKRPGLGLKIVGFLDDHKLTAPHVVGNILDFERIAQQEFINKVYITIHHDSAVFMRILETAKDLGIGVHVVPQGYEVLGQNFTKYNLGIVPVLEYSEIRYRHNQRGKRLFDFISSLMILLFTWPIFGVIAVLIKLDSKGPIFYLSKRYGRGGKIFHMYKFRSMIANADEHLNGLRQHNEVSGPIFKMKCDPRLTKIGKFLRKYSLDELPQLLNVIKGDMSLVGPRPLPIEQVEKEDLRQLRRLDVRPGITGLWQIRGRSDVSFERLVRWDIWYISNWSFSLDLYILFYTIPVVFKGMGAY